MEKLTYGDVYELYFTLISLSSFRPSAKVGYAFARNRAFLKPIVVSLEEIRKVEDPKLEEYNRKRNDLLIRYSKDDEGKPRTRRTPDGGVAYDIPDDKLGAYDKDLKKLREEYKDLVEKIEDAERKFQDQLKEVIPKDENLRLFKIPLSVIPDHELTQSQFNALFPIFRCEDDDLFKEKNKS